LGKCTQPGGVEELRRDFEKLCSWAEKWQMTFNVEKCKVIHIGKKIVEQSIGREMKRLRTLRRKRIWGSGP
jgi:hypothetical protein